MEAQQDFKELLELFNANNVDYIIVGSYALAFHGVPRYTGDIDIFVRPDKENAKSIIKALNDFGFASLNLNVDDFTSQDKIIQLGVSPIRIDILTSITGVTWDDARNGKVSGLYGEVPVYYIGQQELIANKLAVGRKKDLADIEAIGKDIEP